MQSAKSRNEFGVHRSQSFFSVSTNPRFSPLVVLEYGFGDNVDVSVSGDISFFSISTAFKKAFNFESFWESKREFLS